MKSIRFVYLGILISTCPFFQLFSAEPFHTELYTSVEKDEQLLGTKINLPFAEFRTAGSSFSAEKVNFGLSLSSKKLLPSPPFLPCHITVKTGNLSGGGALTKMGNPTLSASTSPFSTGISAPTPLTASLPSYSSFSKPESTFVQLETSRYTKILANLWLTPDAPSPVLSTQLSDSFAANRLTLNLSAVAGRFYYDAASSSSWFSHQAYYRSGTHFCSLLQLSAQYNRASTSTLSATFAAGLYESPFGTLPANLRADLNLKNKKLELFTSAFYNPQQDLITSSQKKIDSCIQIKSGFITKGIGHFFSIPLIIKTGFNTFSSINLLGYEHPLLTNAGIQLSSETATLSFTSSLKLTVPSPPPALAPSKPKFESLTFQLKNSWNLKKISPSAGASISFSSKDGKSSQKYKFTAGFDGEFSKSSKATRSSSKSATDNSTESTTASSSKSTSRNTINGNLSTNFSATYSFTHSPQIISSRKLILSLSLRLDFRLLTIIGKTSVTLE